MIDVSRETGQKLHKYAELVRKWNPHINLVAPTTMSDLETRHIRDSAQLLSLVPKDATSWLDLGSGGGLPGLVIAIGRDDLKVTLIESDKRKASFLRTVGRELNLKNIEILPKRIEEVTPLHAGNISARALAPLPKLLSYVYHHISPTGTAWLMKGKNWKSELDDAEKKWRFKTAVHASQTDPDAVILSITEIGHA